MSPSIMIIGAGPIFGQAVAEKFGREGWSVVLSARRPDRLAKFVAELTAKGITAHAVPADATDPIALRAAIAEGNRLTGGLTAVHFNAAVVRHQDLFSMSDDEVTNDLAINVAAGLHTIRAAVELFSDRGGTILVSGGRVAIAPSAGFASLGVGKAAMRNIVEALFQPLAERNIRIATATVATKIEPNSAASAGVADTIWDLATNPVATWEASYPAA